MTFYVGSGGSFAPTAGGIQSGSGYTTLYTNKLGALSPGTYQIYTTVTNSTGTLATSLTNTFTVVERKLLASGGDVISPVIESGKTYLSLIHI